MKILPWAIASLLLLVVYVLYCEIERLTPYEDGAKTAEAELLKEQDLIVLGETERTELEARLRTLAEQHQALNVELEKVKKATPKVKIVRVIETSIGTVVASGSPVDTPVVAPTTGLGTEGIPPESPLCLLSQGDKATIWIREVELKTERDNHILIGEAEAWRLFPTPATRLFEGPFNASLTIAEKDKPPHETQWSTGELALFSGIAASIGLGLGWLATR